MFMVREPLGTCSDVIVERDLTIRLSKSEKSQKLPVLCGFQAFRQDWRDKYQASGTNVESSPTDIEANDNVWCVAVTTDLTFR